MCTKKEVVNNHYAMYKYKRIKMLGVTDYINQTKSKHFGQKMSHVQHPLNEKILMKCPHLQCVNNHNAKFEYLRIGMQIFRLQ